MSLVEPDGQRSMLADRGANLALRPADLPPLPAGGHLHLSGYTLLDDVPRAAGLAALAAAVGAGCTISVDPASTGPLAAYGVDRWLADTAAATLVLPNADEARLLTGCGDVEAAARALAARHDVVAIEPRRRRRALGVDRPDVHGRRTPPPWSTPPAPATPSRPGCSRRGSRRRIEPATALDAGLALAADVVRRPGAR